MKRRLLAATILTVAIVSSASAQDYSFAVPKADVQVFVEPDASIQIHYDITFENQRGARAIDIVDIGVPHAGYALGTLTASIDGQPLTDIRPSEYVKPGFEVHLDSHVIPPGGTGTLHVEFPMPEMIYQDTTDAAKASLRFTPTWFGEQFVEGTTHLRIAVHLPAGVRPEEAVYHNTAFTDKAIFGEDRHTVVVWEWPATRFTNRHLVGVSFPKRAVDRVISMSAWQLFVRWFEERPPLRILAALAFYVGLGILFFRMSAGTGISVFVVLSAALGFWFYHSASAQLLAIPVLGAAIAFYEWFVRSRKPRYLPAIAEVEGGGIKRGLTAPEAAALLELPLARVLGLVIFGMLKKGILRQVAADPLTVEVADAFRLPESASANPRRRAQLARKIAAENQTVVHNYEPAFLYLVETNRKKPLAEINFSVPLKQLLQHVAGRMKGFDLSDTQDYYRSIVKRAIAEARSVGDIEHREQVIDRNLEWLLMDDGGSDVFSSSGRSYRPSWTRSTQTYGGAVPVPTAPRETSTSFGDVAGSFAGWTENTMGSLASAIQPGTLSISTPSHGLVDLSGADRLTGEFFKALAESKGGGGGGGGGCACAGCACACACAGGGR